MQASELAWKFKSKKDFTTYLDKDTRVSRDQDDKLFVYTRVGPGEATDYSDRPSDLGIGDLLGELAGV